MMEIGSSFADGLRPRWAPGINTVSSSALGDIDAWLSNGSYAWMLSVGGTVKLDVRGSEKIFTSALAAEISRFSCAAYESLIDASPPAASARSLGWSVVRHYYATFYGAHAILRIAGASLTYVSGATASRLNRVGGQYLGVSPQISAGLHVVELASGFVTLTPVSSNGGSHEEMWKKFLLLMTEIENDVVRTQGQAPLAVEMVRVSTALRNLLCQQGKGNGAWPSTVRNAVNYRHDYGVWYPYKRTERECTDLYARMNKWRPNAVDGFAIGPQSDDLIALAEICNVVTNLLTAALRDISKRSMSTSRNFVDREPFRLLRSRQVAI